LFVVCYVFLVSRFTRLKANHCLPRHHAVQLTVKIGKSGGFDNTFFWQKMQSQVIGIKQVMTLDQFFHFWAGVAWGELLANGGAFGSRRRLDLGCADVSLPLDLAWRGALGKAAARRRGQTLACRHGPVCAVPFVFSFILKTAVQPRMDTDKKTGERDSR
jgi:hypothetical protein